MGISYPPGARRYRPGFKLPPEPSLLLLLEADRHQLARELHDETGQILAASLFAIDAYVAGLPSDSAAGVPELRAIRDNLVGAMRDLRGLVYRLHPPMLVEHGLGPSIHWLVQRTVTKPDVRVSVDVSLDGRLPAALEMAVYRIVQESLTNVVKHSRARTVRVRVYDEPGWIRIEVEDDGQGFQPRDGFQSANPTFGLVGMRERAREFGGDLHITTLPTQGTIVRASLQRSLPNASHSRTTCRRSPHLASRNSSPACRGTRHQHRGRSRRRA